MGGSQNVMLVQKEIEKVMEEQTKLGYLKQGKTQKEREEKRVKEMKK
jgi:hypothetical protein